MVAGNIFRLIDSLFTDILFVPFNEIRLNLALQDYGWWISNGINWLFLVVLLVLFAYWMKESLRFKNEGIEDRV